MLCFRTMLAGLLLCLACCSAQELTLESVDLDELRTELQSLLAGVEDLQRAHKDGTLTCEALAEQAGSLADRWEDLRYQPPRLGSQPLGEWLFDFWVVADGVRGMPKTLATFGLDFTGSCHNSVATFCAPLLRQISEQAADLTSVAEALRQLEACSAEAAALIEAGAATSEAIEASNARCLGLLETALAGMPDILGTSFDDCLELFGAVALRELSVQAQIHGRIENMGFLVVDLKSTETALRAWGALFAER